MEFSDPPRSGIVARLGRLLAKVAWSNDQLDIVEPRARDEHEEFFHRRISDRETSDGLRASMDHDVSAKHRKIPPVPTGLLDIICVRIIDAQGQMVSAVRIQKLNPIEAFGDLFITFAQLRTNNSARRENRVGENNRGPCESSAA